MPDDDRRFDAQQVGIVLATASRYESERKDEIFLTRKDLADILLQSGYHEDTISRSLAVIDNTGLEHRLVNAQEQVSANKTLEENLRNIRNKQATISVNEVNYEANCIAGGGLSGLLGLPIPLFFIFFPLGPIGFLSAIACWIIGTTGLAFGGYGIGKKLAKSKNESFEYEVERLEDQVKVLQDQLKLTQNYPIHPNSLVMYVKGSNYICSEVISCEENKYEIQYSTLSSLYDEGRQFEVIRRKVEKKDILGVFSASHPLDQGQISQIAIKEPLFYCEENEVAEYGFLVKRDAEKIYLSHEYPDSSDVLPIATIPLNNVHSGKGSLYRLAIAI